MIKNSIPTINKIFKYLVAQNFEGGQITSDGGVYLLAQIDNIYEITGRLSKCFTDYRNEKLIEFDVEKILRQITYGYCLGYEDHNDHDELNSDPALAAAVGIDSPDGSGRKSEKNKGKPLAGKSTINRFINTPPDTDGKDRSKKIRPEFEKIAELFVEIFLDAMGDEPDEIILDFDNTDIPVYGNQENKFFHGYYDKDCFLPLYCFCNGFPLLAQLNEASEDGAARVTDFLEWAIPMIRERWENTKILIRGDSGFKRDEIMSWIEKRENLYFVLGMGKNSRLNEMVKEVVEEAKLIYKKKLETEKIALGDTIKIYRNISYRTKDSWSRKRRICVKCEYSETLEAVENSEEKEIVSHVNVRHVVTNIKNEDIGAETIYKDTYCPRGEMENRIKEQQLCLFADRTSSTKFYSNQMRVWMATYGYVLLHLLRITGLKGTKLEKARCDTIRLKLLKIGAQIKVTARRVIFKLSSSYTEKKLYSTVINRLCY
ncbi:MAG: IS1380 family transposase [Deltaproteobacteria bacterium]|jgi:hypothetical protein|nr:IS1380 family transposase [Deltaproteobacteria bacterium]